MTQYACRVGLVTTLLSPLPVAAQEPLTMDGAVQAALGVETMVGVSEDPSFGALVAFGLGGIPIEVRGDVGFRIVRSARVVPFL